MSKKFFLADTFQNSLSRLNVLEQKIAKTAAFDLQMNSSSPALNCHRISKIKDKNFWSARGMDAVCLSDALYGCIGRHFHFRGALRGIGVFSGECAVVSLVGQTIRGVKRFRFLILDFCCCVFL